MARALIVLKNQKAHEQSAKPPLRKGAGSMERSGLALAARDFFEAETVVRLAST